MASSTRRGEEVAKYNLMITAAAAAAVQGFKLI